MDLYFLEASYPLVKTLKQNDKGEIVESPYPMAYNFTSHKESVQDLSDFKNLLDSYSTKQFSLIKGSLSRDLVSESRRGSTDPFTRTSWICLDLDNFEDESALSLLLDKMGLSETSYVLQYSSKHGIVKPFSAHLFFMLDDAVLPGQLKTWFMHCNLTIPMLSDRITLTRTSAALRWPLDISLAQNDKIVYIAPPNCIGFDDPVKSRISIVTKKLNTINISTKLEELDSSVVLAKKNDKLNELRKSKGLKSRSFNMKAGPGNIEVLSKPGEVEITGKKADRGFMYFNLNGGDSWGYYHPLDNPEIIFNFKGEPPYLTKELLPTYYNAYKKAEIEEQQGEVGDTKFFAFLDRRSDRYYRGTYDPSKDSLELYPTDGIRKVCDFMKQNGQPIPDPVLEWDYLFRFEDDRVFVPEERFVNQYQRSKYIRNAGKNVKTFPPTIKRVLMSVSGDNLDTFKHLINWVATIVQKRQRTQTMWVFHGVPGTGKGVLVHEILAPILGPEYVQVKSLSSLEEEYNQYMERSIILMIDESKRTQTKNAEKVLARLKQATTDPVIPIRKMRSDPYMAKNYMNIIIASNYPDPIKLEAGDRRVNVAEYQTKKLRLNADDIKSIRSELTSFASILMNIEVDVEKAKTPLENEARKKLMYLTQNSLEIMFGAITTGNLEFFIDLLPSDSSGSLDPLHSMDLQHYITVLKEAEACAKAKVPHKLTRDQARTLAHYALNDMPKSAHKFSSLSKHHGIQFTRVSKEGRKCQAITVDWALSDIRVDDILERSPLKAVK